MADYGFTSHLLTIPVVIDTIVPQAAKIESALGYNDQGVIKPAPAIGKPVYPTANTSTDLIAVAYTTTTDQKPIGVIATKPKWDSNINKFRADIKLFGILMEAYSTTIKSVGATVTFEVASMTPPTPWEKYQLPVITDVGAAGSQMTVIDVRQPDADAAAFIFTVYIPTCDISTTANRLFTMEGEKVKIVKGD